MTSLIACTALSGAAFFLSIGLGESWIAIWLAPVPILWLAFHRENAPVAVVLAGLAACSIGGLNLLPAFSGVMPAAVVAAVVLVPALLFAVAVAGARFIFLRLGPVGGAVGFATLWAGSDQINSLNPTAGAVLTPSAVLAGEPVLLQAASIAGFAGLTFLIGFGSAALAASLSARRPHAALAAAGVIIACVGYGIARLSASPAGSIIVAAYSSDDLVGGLHDGDEARAAGVLRAYADRIAQPSSPRPGLIVLPENLAYLDAGWRDKALAPLADLARRFDTTIVAGFNTHIDGHPNNVAWAATADARPVLYAKRHLVQGLETPYYIPGRVALTLASGLQLEVCKDMDFPDMIRADVATGHPRLLAVPAWDFGADGWAHARIAIMRSVENAVPMVRSARNGLLTVNDQFGRVVARVPSGAGLSGAVTTLSLYPGSGRTIYTLFGYTFGWGCIMASILLLLASAFRRPGGGR